MQAGWMLTTAHLRLADIRSKTGRRFRCDTEDQRGGAIREDPRIEPITSVAKRVQRASDANVSRAKRYQAGNPVANDPRPGRFRAITRL